MCWKHVLGSGQSRGWRHGQGKVVLCLQTKVKIGFRCKYIGKRQKQDANIII